MSRLFFTLPLVVVAVLICSPASVISQEESTSSTSTTTVPTPEASTSSASTSSQPESSSRNTVDEKRFRLLSVENVEKCGKDDVQLGDCVKRILAAIIPELKDGNEELNIPPLDPFSLNTTTFQYANGGVMGRISIKNTKAYGFSEMKHQSMDFKIENGKTDMNTTVHIPKIEIIGNYKAEAALNNLRFKPKGVFNVTLLNVTIDQTAMGEVSEKNGHSFVHLIKFESEPKVGDIEFHATGIFPDPELNEVFLNVINQYWRDIYRVMLPETRRYWGPLLLTLMNEILSVTPLDAYIKDL